MVSSHGAEMNDVVGGDIKQQVLNRIRLWCDLTLGVGSGAEAVTDHHLLRLPYPPGVFDLARVFRLHRMTHGAWRRPLTIPAQEISRVAF